MLLKCSLRCRYVLVTIYTKKFSFKRSLKFDVCVVSSQTFKEILPHNLNFPWAGLGVENSFDVCCHTQKFWIQTNFEALLNWPIPYAWSTFGNFIIKYCVAKTDQIALLSTVKLWRHVLFYIGGNNAYNDKNLRMIMLLLSYGFIFNYDDVWL